MRVFPLLLVVCMGVEGGEDEGGPEQVHIALGAAGSLAVGWVTRPRHAGGGACSRDSVVKFGSSKKQIDEWSAPGVVHATPADKRNTFFHSATLHGLVTGQTYYYSVGSAASADCWSPVHAFRVPGHDDVRPMTVAMFGDLGLHKNEALPCLASEATSGALHLAIHAGDLAYDLASEKGARGDEWLRAMMPVAARIPYMVAAGNHDAKDHFLQFALRFQMPAAASGSGTLEFELPARHLVLPNSRFYSFNAGLVHFVCIDTEVMFHDDDEDDNEESLDARKREALLAQRQRLWLRNDLTQASSSRRQRPWIVAFGHRPLYCSADKDHCIKDGRVLQEEFASVFHEFGVDLYVSGHVHVYERMFDISPPSLPRNGTGGSGGSSFRGEPHSEGTTTNMRATTFIVSGTAGPDKLKKKFKMPPPAFSAVRIRKKYGYGRLTVYNASHVRWEQVLCDSSMPSEQQGAILDSVVLIQHHHGSFLDEVQGPGQGEGGQERGLKKGRGGGASAGSLGLSASSEHREAGGHQGGRGGKSAWRIWGWAIGGVLMGLGCGCCGVVFAMFLTVKLAGARGGRVPKSMVSTSLLSLQFLGRQIGRHRSGGEEDAVEEEEAFMMPELQQLEVEGETYEHQRARST